MRSFLVLSLLFGLLHNGAGKVDRDWFTVFEKSGGKRTPRYDSTIAFCKRLAQYSPSVQYRPFGKSPQGRDLPLLLVDESHQFDPQAARKQNKLVVLILAGIHAGEIDGKDAGLMLLRDIVVYGKHRNVLKDMVILFIPIFNVDGHERFGPYNRINQNGPEEMGWRTTAQNFNLNRDFLKADTPEMQAFLRLYQRWLPDFAFDCHVTDGADYQYVLTYGLDNSPQLASPVRNWAQQFFEPAIRKFMDKQHIPVFPYFNLLDKRHPEKGMISFPLSPRFSTGYGSVQNRVFLLIETHMLKPYARRVWATYFFLLGSLHILQQEKDRLLRANKTADMWMANHQPGQFIPIRFRPDFQDTVWVDFKGIDFQLVPSDISGSTWIRYTGRPRTFRVPYFHQITVTDSVSLPYAYLIPPQWQQPIRRLQMHGVQLAYLQKDTTLEVETYHFSDVHWQEQPYEGHHRVRFRVNAVREQQFFPRGTVVVFTNQRCNALIVHALEPRAPDSFVQWGMWDTIFERKEYAELYKLEELARQMLANDPQLKQAFYEKLQADSAFRANPRARLYFFYERSPYWDKNWNKYPVGRLLTPTALPVDQKNPLLPADEVDD